MKQTINNIMTRLRKYAVFLILLPLLIGAFSYFLTEEEGGTITKQGIYFAEAQLDLGEFNDPMLNHPDNVKNLISSSTFLEEVAAEVNADLDIDEVKANLVLENVQGEWLIVRLTGKDEEIVTMTLQGIVDQLMDLSNQRYTEWTELINQTIEELEATAPGSEEAVTKREFLYNLKQDLYNSSPAEVTEPVRIVNEKTAISSDSVSPFKRMVFGLIIGAMLSLFLLLLPEAFRD